MLDSRIMYGDGDAEIMAQTYKDLTRCHKIHTLNLEIFQAGCMVSPYIDQRAFDFGENARFLISSPFRYRATIGITRRLLGLIASLLDNHVPT